MQGERGGADHHAPQGSRRLVPWRVPKRRGIVPDGMVQSRLTSLVEKFPNLGRSNIAKTATSFNCSGEKRKFD